MLAHQSSSVPAPPMSRMDWMAPLASGPATGMEQSKELEGSGDRKGHVPVLLAEVMEALAVIAGGTCVDATFGAGSYSEAILSSHETTRVLALDRDRGAVRGGQALVARAGGRLTLVEGRFG